MTTTTLRLQQRKGTASQWSTSNPVLGDGEFGYDVTNNILKIGKSSTAWSSLPSFLTTAGGTLTGALTLSGAPSSNLHAATKSYVDTSIANLIGTAPETLDTIEEIAAALTSTATGSILDNIATKLPLAGGTLSGLLTLSGAPTSDLHAATKLYVDSKTYSLDNLSDVSTSNTQTNDFLQYTGSGWVNSPITTTEIANFSTTTPADGQYLVYVAGTTNKWTPSSLNLSGYVTDTSTNTLTNKTLTAPKLSVTTESKTLTAAAASGLGSTSILVTGNVANLSLIGKIITGANIPANTTITAVTSATNSTITISNGLLTGGVSSGASLVVAGVINSTPVYSTIESDSAITTIVPNTDFGRAPIATPIFTSGIGTSGTAATTNYALFPSANDTITLPVGTYRIETAFQVASTSTTGSTLLFSIRGSGSAVGTMTWDGTSSITLGSASNEYQVAATALTSAITVTASSSVARSYVVRGSGILKITTAGTITPSYQFSGAVGGTTTLYAENYLIITPLSSSGTAISTGAWA